MTTLGLPCHKQCMQNDKPNRNEEKLNTMFANLLRALGADSDMITLAHRRVGMGRYEITLYMNSCSASWLASVAFYSETELAFDVGKAVVCLQGVGEQREIKLKT